MNTDSIDFHQIVDFQSIYHDDQSSDFNSENLYGSEFLDFNGIRAQDYNEEKKTIHSISKNLPAEAITGSDHRIQNSTMFNSWKALSASTDPKGINTQINPNNGLPRRICFNCGSISTPSWRRCPEGKNLLCNACGLYQKLHGRPRPLIIREDGSVQVIRNTYTIRNICHNCGTTDTPIWRRSQTDRNFLLCNACALYMKNHNSPRPESHTTAGSNKGNNMLENENSLFM